MSSKKVKYIVITGGVISGIGKGVTGASVGHFFSENYNVVPIKMDGYLNTDPGTMNPIEHGEVFVLDDGSEVDMDFGHYERFLNVSCTKEQSITMGKIYKEIHEKERKGDYLGKTVQLIPHVTDLIQDKIQTIAKNNDADIVLIEIGGTIGDLENELYVEAIRQLQLDLDKDQIYFIHMSYIPIPYGVDEQKTKPTQQSINLLQSKGVWPNSIICRCSNLLNKKNKEKIAMFSSLKSNNVYTAYDVTSVYRIPGMLKEQGLIKDIEEKLNLPIQSLNRHKKWVELLNVEKEKVINVCIGGKYTDLEDSYASIVESLKHCEYHFKSKIKISWIDTSKPIHRDEILKYDAVIVPGGFGSRGIDGKIELIKIVRENNIPYLGICYGMQLAILEFLRNKCGIKDAQTMEVESSTKTPAIVLMDEQKNVVDLGGTMRLGSYDAIMNTQSIIFNEYNQLMLVDLGTSIVKERHRHRYEVNPNFVKYLEEGGMHVVGRNPNTHLVEFIELDKKQHRYFVATQAHPELKSKLEKPSPLFFGLINAAVKNLK